jgi:glycosyltransferase involved in cell wall biosynthesis
MSNKGNQEKVLKLGVVANEFFDASVGRLGGFGWATSQVARFFTSRPELGVEVVFLSRDLKAEDNEREYRSHGVRLLPMRPSKRAYWRSVKAENIDVMLTIDYRPNYDELIYGLSRTPVIVWMRDPRTREDASRLLTIRVPGQEDVVPQTAGSFIPSLKWIMRFSAWRKRPFLFAATTRYLAHKVEDAYRVDPQKVSILPNIIDLDPGEIRKSDKPGVVFLARLDPYKRPWVVVELARDFPEVDFFLCGEKQVTGVGAWEAENLPENVHLVGHANEDEKLRLLSSAWVLINTSMHEGLAVSFQEALRCETPVLSSVDPQGVVSAYGIFAGYWEGTGLDGLPRFRAGLRKLLDDDELRKRLGRKGREWVQRTHTPELFYAAFRELCLEARVQGAEDLPIS